MGNIDLFAEVFLFVLRFTAFFFFFIQLFKCFIAC